MAKEYAKKFYNSSLWKRCRTAFISYRISVDGGMCQHCGKELGFIVDHMKEITPENINDPEITLSHHNLQYLCLECHNTKTFEKDKAVDKGYRFDETGRLVPVGTPPIQIED